MKNLNLSYLIAVILTVVTLTACSTQSDQAAQNQELETVTLQLSWTHETAFVGFYAAIDQNYYQEEGIDLKFIEGGFDANGYINPMNNVENGKAQFGLHSGNSILEAKASGTPFVVIASTYQTSPRAFISLVDKNILTPQDWVGKRVAIRIGGDAEISYIALVNNLGINRDDIIENTDSAVDNIDALINDEIDVIPIYAPEEPVELERMGYEVNTIFAQDYGVGIPLNALFTTEDMVTNNPELVEKFLRATIKGFDYAIRNPNEAAELVTQYTDISAEDILPHVRRTIPLFQPAGTHPGQINTVVWQQMQDMLVEQGILDKPIDLTTLYDLSFQQKVFSELYESQS